MTLASILLLISALLIYLSSEYFVNGIEWVGHHLNISQKVFIKYFGLKIIFSFQIS